MCTPIVDPGYSVLSLEHYVRLLFVRVISPVGSRIKCFGLVNLSVLGLFCLSFFGLVGCSCGKRIVRGTGSGSERNFAFSFLVTLVCSSLINLL